MPLALLVGPANAGKVARLLDRYVGVLDRDPLLIVPGRADVERIERELLLRVEALVGGWIGTFDDLFERLAGPDDPSRTLSSLERSLIVRRVLAQTSLGRFARSAKFPGFADGLVEAIAELQGAMVDHSELDGELASLYGGYLLELARLEVWDRERRERLAVERIAGELSAWEGAPVFAYGFESLTGTQWALLEALAGRSEVTVSLPYEPGRVAFEAVRATAEDLARLAGSRIEELPPVNWEQAPALAHLERVLFEGGLGSRGPQLDGALRFYEAAGMRSTLEMVAEEILQLVRGGVPPGSIAVLAPDVARLATPLETVFGSLQVPHALDSPIRLGRTGLGRALLGILRFAWGNGQRGELFTFLRSPYAGLARARVDFVEGRLRGRGIAEPARVEEEATRLLGEPLPALAGLRGGEGAIEVVRRLVAGMLRAAHGLERLPTGNLIERDLRVREEIGRALADLQRWEERSGSVAREDVLAALDGLRVHRPSRPEDRVAVLDFLRARTRHFEVVFVLGLEEGILPRRTIEAPLLSDDLRAVLEANGRGRRRLSRADVLARDRYLFYTAITRARSRLYLVREAATEDGRPLEPSPFWDDVRACFDPDEIVRATRRRSLSEATWELHRAPSERERLRAVAALGASEPEEARALARANGWERRIERALTAFSRPTRLVNRSVVEGLRDIQAFSVTELEQFGDCSSMWLLERVVSPRDIDAEIDPRLRGSVAHQTLYRFYSGLPRRFGVDHVDPDRLDEAVEFLLECLGEALRSQVRLELPELGLLELEGSLARDLEQFVRRDVELGLPLVPRRFEVGFGSDRAATELQRGLDLGDFFVSGKIDRVDVDLFSARGIVQDYKSGTAFSALQIGREKRLQIPLYVLALRDLLGIEPVGGLYRSLSGERETRGILRADARDDLLPGLAPRDYLSEEEFWATVEAAKEQAREAVARIRAGLIEHDPRGGECPAWCDLWPMCRVRRA